jgi:precorrin-2 dehydrogenase/sirohydrochlorin ferrochelatase
MSVNTSGSATLRVSKLREHGKIFLRRSHGWIVESNMRMPFYIDVTNKRILIIGGGSEGAKRAAKYTEAGAHVTVLAKRLNRELQAAATSGAVTVVRADASDIRLVDQLIADSDLVMVALDTKEFNDALVAAAQRAHKFVNLTNDAASTEVIVPVENEVHGIRLAATSEGKSVHVAREALQRATRFLEQQRDLWFMLQLMQELRQTLRQRQIPLETRMRIYSTIYWDRRVREQAEGQNMQEARAAMYAAVNRLLETTPSGNGRRDE